MRQLLLNLEAPKPQSFESFVEGRNQELLQRLTQLAVTDAAALSDRFIYLWGEPGSGRTHLLRAVEHAAQARYLKSDDDPAAFASEPTIRLYLVDDCERLSAEAQIAAFALFTQVRENGAALITAGANPPALLAVREDLRTRLGWGLVYQVQGLTDEEK